MTAARKARDPDPPDALRTLEARTEQGLARGYVIRGPERYFRERAVSILRKRAEAEGYEVCRHVAQRRHPDYSAARLVDDLRGGGLFATRRLVVIQSPTEELRKTKDGKPSALTQAILDFVESSEDRGTVVLDGESLRADHATVKAIGKAGGSVLSLRKLFDSPPPWRPDVHPTQIELVRWLLGRAREKGLRLEPPSAVYVCAATGNDLFALDAQLDRLREMPGAELAEAVGWQATTTPWSVADHLLDGDLPRSLAGLETLFRGGFQEKSGKRLLDPGGLTTMLVNQVQRGVRQSLHLALELEGGANEDELGQRLGLGARARAGVARARSRPASEWRSMFEASIELQRRLNFVGIVDAHDLARFALRWARGKELR